MDKKPTRPCLEDRISKRVWYENVTKVDYMAERDRRRMRLVKRFPFMTDETINYIMSVL